MRLHPSWPAVLVAFATAASAGGPRPPQAKQKPPASRADPKPSGPAAFCAAEYADDLAALTAEARAADAAQAPYTFCVRTIATYECPFYAGDGTLHRTRRTVVAHGTAFAYRRDDNGSLLLTNEHVAEWPAVTDEEHPVEDVPVGCRRVSDVLKIVDDEADAYERDDIPLTRVASDPSLDIAVLRARVPLAVLPWKVGHSAAIREGNAVEVRGFPLGVLRARNGGKVVSAYTHDEEHDWNHDDFVVDALLSPGNSGSPVLAVSCRTGQFELVGVYHAGYARGSALNVVVGIDQVRDLMTTLKRTTRPRGDGPTALDRPARGELQAGLADAAGIAFPFGPLTATARPRADGAVVFAIQSREFPLRAVPALALEDLAPAADDAFGAPGRVFAGNRQGLRGVPRAELDADAQAQLARLLDALRHEAIATIRYRVAARGGAASRERFEAVSRLEHAARKSSAARADLAQFALDLAARLAPDTADGPLTLADLVAGPPPVLPVAQAPVAPVATDWTPAPISAPAAAVRVPARPVPPARIPTPPLAAPAAPP
jgi:serine protease Do